MTVYNVGSINIDHVYRVPHLVRPGETLQSQSLRNVLGGKGANQSVALARAGAPIEHVGRLGEADGWALDAMREAGVGVTQVATVSGPSGHAIIQVDDQGENAIVLHGGANLGIEPAWLEQALETAVAGDWLLMQNECDGLAAGFEIAARKQMNVAFNPAPMTAAARCLPLQQCALLIVNEIEARQLAGEGFDASPCEALANELSARLPSTQVVLTLGAQGALMVRAGSSHRAPALSVPVVDTTGAGDTFVGYFLASIRQGAGPAECLQRACAAAALSVTRSGATPSIPGSSELDTWQALRDASTSAQQAKSESR